MNCARNLLLAVLAAVVAGGSAAEAAIDARLLRQPDVSATHIAFVYAGDVWIVPKEGGQAQRLSTPPGEESFPRFSPDGQHLAYSGNYDGNTDIYVVPVTGGVPARLTYHPMVDRILDWYPDGKSLLYASAMASGKQRFSQLYRLPREGGLPEKLPVPYGEFGAVAADGRTLAYAPISVDFRTWKRYRGGMAPDLWLFDLDRHTSKNVTQSVASEGQPMWHDKTLYYLSDADEALRNNIWAYDTASGKSRQITRFTEHDIHFPAVGPSELVFENAGRLYLLDLATEKHRPVDVQVLTDRATLKPQLKNVSELVQQAHVSPTGKRAVIQARGEVFSVPAEHGPILNLSRSSGYAERYPTWSSDGKEIAYFSDRTGEYELTVRPADGSGEERTLTRFGPGFRYRPVGSPDGKKFAFVDQAMKMWIHDRDSGKSTEIDRGLFMMHGGLSSWRPSWSPDSRWLAYDRDLPTGHRALFLHDTRSAKSHQVTSGFYDDSLPVFDPDGKYLYLRTTRSFDPVYSDFDNSWVYNNSTQLAAVPLRTDVPSPLAPRNDHEGKDEADGDEDEKSDSKADDEDEDDDDAGKDEKRKTQDSDDEKSGDKAKGEKAPPKPVEIELADFERRLVVLPPKAGNYASLGAATGKLVYLRQPRTGSDDEKGSVVYWDFEEREEKTVLEEVDDYVLTFDGKKLLARKDETLAIVELKEKQKLEKPLRVAELEMEIDPAAEWRQLFLDAWRFERDYFYDPNMHGVNWVGMRERYGKLLDDAVTRWDVNFVIGELISELNASHAYRGGGDAETPRERRTGLLGADFAFENGAYRITKILDGAAWDSEVRSPLRESGVNVKEGDWLLAVNRMRLDARRDPWAALAGLAEKPVLLTVNSKPELEGSRQVLVKTLADETRLRNLAWIENNRQRVERATNGRVGYIYVPSTGVDGQTELARMYWAQTDREGLIIDERFNNGGQIPDRFVELLDRPPINYWAVRDGRDWQWPPTGHYGPKAMLINQWSGSGGDCFPYYFKRAGLGPLIGMRTWGGLIGISGAPGLIDGGSVTVPTFSFYGTEGDWLIEGHGVDPDIEVVDDPAKMVDGGDPQLDRAIEEVLKALEREPPKHPKRPAYTNRAGR